MEWFNGKTKIDELTFVFPIKDPLAYPYQAIEEQRRDNPALSA
jgi:hypothetical protein